MGDELIITNGIRIPAHELEITASRAGGPGGQHVNKASTRIMVRWNLNQTGALSDEQKDRVRVRLQSEITAEGDLIVQSGESRSQYQNKEEALARLAHKIRIALHVPKKRVKTKASPQKKEARLQEKKRRSVLKKMRVKKYD